MEEVPEANEGMLQAVMSNDIKCDVVLRCPDGDVGVHSAVLATASRVLAAMMLWPTEGDASLLTPDAPPTSNQFCMQAEAHDVQVSQLGRPRIGLTPRMLPLQDRRAVVEAWRELVYTGLPPFAEEDRLTTDLLLDILDLSHRWQDLLFQSGLLTAALARRVRDDSGSEACGKILEAAIARELPALRSECLAVARRSSEVRRDWEQGLFTGEVKRQLDSLFGLSALSGMGSSPSRRWNF
jgi:hypothetical protein